MTIGEKIYKIRTELGMTQKEFADKIGASQSAVNFWENGKRQPRLKQVREMATALGMYAYQFIDDWGEFDSSEFFEEACDNESHYENVNPRAEMNKQRLLEKYSMLNYIGQEKAIEQVEMLTKIPEYQAEKDD